MGQADGGVGKAEWRGDGCGNIRCAVLVWI